MAFVTDGVSTVSVLTENIVPMEIEDGIPAYYENADSYGFKTVGSGAWNYPLRTVTAVSYESSLPTVTVPELNETIEQIMQKVRAGLPVPPSLLRAQTLRTYPTDPESVQTAAALLEQAKTVAQANLKANSEALKAAKIAAKLKAKEVEKEAELFEKFKRSLDQPAK